jgi:tetratricopeptide (TPR) repeat protein
MPVTTPAFDPRNLSLEALVKGMLVDSVTGSMHSERDLDVTIVFYQNVVKLRPAKPHYLSLGLCLYAKGYSDASEWYLQEGTKGEPHPVALVLLAERAMTRCRTGEAIDMLEESLRLRKSPVPACRLAEAYLTLKQNTVALEYCRKALSFDPASLEVQKLMGVCLLAADLPKEALVYLKKLEAADPSSPQNCNLMGNAYKQLGRTKDAIGQYQRALVNSPNVCLVSAHLSIAASYFDLGEFKTMLWHLTEVRAAGHSLALTSSGFSMLFESNELIEALQQFVNGDYAGAAANLGGLWERTKKNVAVAFFYGTATQKASGNSKELFEKVISMGRHHTVRDLAFVKQLVNKAERALTGMEETDNLSVGSMEDFEELSQDRVVNVCRSFSHNSSRIEGRLHKSAREVE